MRKIYVVSTFLLVLVLIIGCAPKEAPPITTPEPTEPVEQPEVTSTTPTTPTAPTTPTNITPTTPKEESPKADITITATGINPAELTIKVGETITFVNAKDSNALLGSPINSGTIKPKGSFSKKFDTAGEYSYMDVVNKKKGKIIVKAETTT